MNKSKINSVIEKTKNSKTPVVSIFHEFSSVDHSFEEIRVLLKNAKDEMDRYGQTCPPVVERILNDERVQGEELDLKEVIRLSEDYFGAYFYDNDIYPVNLTTPVKDSWIVSEKPFVLPLMLNKDNACYVLKVSDDECTLHKFEDQHLQSAMKTSLPKDLEDYLDINRAKDQLDDELVFDEDPGDGRKNHRENREHQRQRYFKHILSTIEKIIPNEERLIILHSSRYNSIVKEADSMLSHIDTDRIFHSELQNRDTIESKVTELLNLENEHPYIELEEKKSIASSSEEWISDLKAIDSQLAMGNVSAIGLNERLLDAFVEKLHEKEDLLRLNKWVIEHLNRVPYMNVENFSNSLVGAKLFQPDQTPQDNIPGSEFLSVTANLNQNRPNIRD